jgi:hypothetical protein
VESKLVVRDIVSDPATGGFSMPSSPGRPFGGRSRSRERTLVAVLSLLVVYPTALAANNTASSANYLAVDPEARLPPLEGPSELQVRRCSVMAWLLRSVFHAALGAQLTGTYRDAVRC